MAHWFTLSQNVFQKLTTWIRHSGTFEQQITLSTSFESSFRESLGKVFHCLFGTHPVESFLV
jgi:hypothetical protein